MAYAFVSPQLGAGLGFSKAPRDPLVEGDSDGVRFIWDLAFPYSYPGGPKPRSAAGNPANGALIYSAATKGNDSALTASVVLQSGQTLTYAGGGFDFNSLTTGPDYIEGPGDFITDITTTVNGATQRYLACMYLKVPASGDWNTYAGTVMTLLSFANSGSNYTNSAELFMIDESVNNGKRFEARRQNSAGTIDGIMSLDPTSANYGLLGQLAFYRTASLCGFRLRTVNGIILVTAAVGSNNSVSLTGLKSKWGITPAFARTTLSDHGTAKNFRIYRGFLENLARSQRDPVAVLDADWTRVQARIAASAAANGGTSTIFV